MGLTFQNLCVNIDLSNKEREVVKMITVEMFKDYKEEDMRFLNLYGRDSVHNGTLASQITADVDALSDDDKDKIIHMILEAFEYYKSLIKEVNEDKENGVVKGKDSYGHWRPHFGSIKAWRKRHDLSIGYMADTDDLMYIVPYRRWATFYTALTLNADKEELDRFVKNYICQYIFMNTKKEYTYFSEHDEYYILADKLEQRHTYQDFNDYYFYAVNGVAYKKLNNDNKEATEMSLEELKAVNAFLDRLDNDVNMLISKSFSEFPIDK
jgi:hypothetical protein